MKELKISQLMDDYTDNEVCIEGETLVDNAELKGLVLEQVKTKRKVKPLFKVLIAAAAAATVCVAGVAVVGSDFKSGSFTTGSGIQFEYEVHENGSSTYARLDYIDTLTTEDGRLYLNTEDITIDITDLTDEKTPYIYTYTNSGTGEDAYIIAVGTPAHYEFADLFRVEGIGWIGHGCINGSGMNSIRVNITQYPELKEFEPSRGDPAFSADRWIDIEYNNFHRHQGYRDENGDYMSIDDNHVIVPMIPETENCSVAWFISAIDQLDLLP